MVYATISRAGGAEALQAEGRSDLQAYHRTRGGALGHEIGYKSTFNDGRKVGHCCVLSGCENHQALRSALVRRAGGLQRLQSWLVILVTLLIVAGTLDCLPDS